jgi:hypothetical protein
MEQHRPSIAMPGSLPPTSGTDRHAAPNREQQVKAMQSMSGCTLLVYSRRSEHPGLMPSARQSSSTKSSAILMEPDARMGVCRRTAWLQLFPLTGHLWFAVGVVCQAPGAAQSCKQLYKEQAVRSVRRGRNMQFDPSPTFN